MDSEEGRGGITVHSGRESAAIASVRNSPEGAMAHASRRAAIAVPALSTCDNCNYKRPPHRVCPNCGQYAKRQVVEKE